MRHFDVNPANLPQILTTRQLAGLLGVCPETIYAWSQTDERLSACVLRRTKHSTWWSCQRLREAGFLLTPVKA